VTVTRELLWRVIGPHQIVGAVDVEHAETLQRFLAAGRRHGRSSATT
jgi:hypothetical protein